MKTGSQIRLLLWKNWTLRRRQKVGRWKVAETLEEKRSRMEGAFDLSSGVATDSAGPKEEKSSRRDE